MPVAQRFEVLNGHDLADLSGFEDIADSFGIFGVAQHMADGEHHAGFFDSGDDIFARLSSRSHRFFQQDMITAFGAGDRRSFVEIILRTDRHGIAHFRLGDKFLIGFEAHCFGNIVEVAHFIPAEIIGVSDRHDLQTFRKLSGVSGVTETARTGSDHCEFDRICHFSSFRVIKICLYQAEKMLFL